MEKKFQAFLDNAFAPYGNFPARADVTQELLANLQEKYACTGYLDHPFRKKHYENSKSFLISLANEGRRG